MTLSKEDVLRTYGMDIRQIIRDTTTPGLAVTQMAHLHAPWTPEQVERLKKRQACAFIHPYTCGTCGFDLEPTTEGWVCPKCSYEQYWCHAGDAQPSDLPMSENADAIAQQLVGMDNYTRQQTLAALRECDKDMHALVMQKMEEIRRSARSQGGQTSTENPTSS